MTTPQQTNPELLHATKEMEVLSQQLNGQVSSLSSDIAALKERVSDLEQVPVVEHLQERLLTLEIKVQNSLDLTDDLVGTADSVLAQANNVLAHADTVLTLYLFILTIVTSIVLGVIQYLWGKRRDDMIAELKKAHTAELTEKVDQIEEKFLNKLKVDEDFLDTLTGALAKNENFRSAISKQDPLPSPAFDENLNQSDIDSIRNELG
jgi:hypothetical protein